MSWRKKDWESDAKSHCRCNIKIDAGFRADMIIEDSVIIENKTVDQIAPIHEAQLLTYLRITGISLGFLLNWKGVLMKDGIKRMVNNLKG